MQDLRDLMRHLRQRWADWCGDREMEVAIRRCLSDQGYYGAGARLQQVRLVAVQRPGWVQIYRFEATARVAVAVDDDAPEPAAQYHQLFGLIRDDARAGPARVRVFRAAEERKALFIRWAEDLICLRGAADLRN